MGMNDKDIERALSNVRIVEEARKANANRMDGCPLDEFLRSHVPSIRGISGAWSDYVYRGRYWGESEENFLLENYGVKRIKDIAAQLGRSEKSVSNKVARMELQK